MGCKKKVHCKNQGPSKFKAVIQAPHSFVNPLSATIQRLLRKNLMRNLSPPPPPETAVQTFVVEC